MLKPFCRFSIYVFFSLVLAACNSPDSRRISNSGPTPPPAEPTLSQCETDPPTDDIGIHQCSWEHRALTLQRNLGLNLPLREAQILSSHNSYNSSSYPGLSSSDLNQTRTLLEQFQLGMRSIELDVHWIFHAESGAHAPVTCHGLAASQEHTGCSSNDRHINSSLDEILAFLDSPQGADQVLFLDIEDHLSPAPLSGAGTSSEEAHAAALAAISSKLGHEIYQPPQDGSCHSTPMGISQQDILNSGKRILLNAPCDASGWGLWAFEVNSVRPGQKAHSGFSGYPDCDSADFSFTQYRERWVREWEDTTQVGAASNGSLQRMSDSNLQDMAHCGLNFASLDRVDPNPPAVGPGNPTYLGQGINFAALVWSWSENKPAVTTATNPSLDCAYLDVSDGRLHDGDCSINRPTACLQDNALNSPITSSNGLWETGASSIFENASCPSSYHFDVPANGWLKQQLLERMTAAAITQIWVNYRENSANTWQ